jgi:hypothetical protein
MSVRLHTIFTAHFYLKTGFYSEELMAMISFEFIFLDLKYPGNAPSICIEFSSAATYFKLHGLNW